MEELGRFHKPGHENTYEDSFKIAVAREYLTGICSQSQLATKYHLKNCGVVGFFVRWYKRHMAELEEAAAAAPGTTSSIEQDLSHQLYVANLKITALEMMIKNAERELGVDIKKKSGIKPPVK